MKDLKLSPPDIITRVLRSITDNLKHFKASEFRNLLLLYLPMVVMGLLPTVYFNHFLMLSEAIHILLFNEITPELLDRAHGLLLNFCSNVETLYGSKFEYPNFTYLLIW